VSAGASSCVQAVPLYTYEFIDDPTTHKYRHLRTGLRVVSVVEGVGGNNTIASQRRRQR
jgi:hypothetical protein